MVASFVVEGGNTQFASCATVRNIVTGALLASGAAGLVVYSLLGAH